MAAQYLKSKLPNDYPNASAKVHVIGTSGLCGEIMSAGFEVSGGPDSLDTPSGMSRDELADYSFPEGAVDALVVGLDNDFNYRKLCIANVLLQRNPDALFVATNLDARGTSPETGRLWLPWRLAVAGLPSTSESQVRSSPRGSRNITNSTHNGQ